MLVVKGSLPFSDFAVKRALANRTTLRLSTGNPVSHFSRPIVPSFHYSIIPIAERSGANLLDCPRAQLRLFDQGLPGLVGRCYDGVFIHGRVFGYYPHRRGPSAEACAVRRDIHNGQFS